MWSLNNQHPKVRRKYVFMIVAHKTHLLWAWVASIHNIMHSLDVHEVHTFDIVLIEIEEKPHLDILFGNGWTTWNGTIPKRLTLKMNLYSSISACLPFFAISCKPISGPAKSLCSFKYLFNLRLPHRCHIKHPILRIWYPFFVLCTDLQHPLKLQQLQIRRDVLQKYKMAIRYWCAVSRSTFRPFPSQSSKAQWESFAWKNMWLKRKTHKRKRTVLKVPSKKNTRICTAFMSLMASSSNDVGFSCLLPSLTDKEIRSKQYPAYCCTNSSSSSNRDVK